MTTCTYAFTNADGGRQVITGQAAFKAYLLDGGLQHLLPSFAARMPGGAAPAFSGKQDLNDRLQQKIFSDFDAAVREYSSLPGTKKGKLLDTDQARELSDEYRADRSLAPKVHNAASAFTQAAFEKRMANAPDGALVVFMAGGGGAGKSSAEHLLSDAMDRANTILDGTLSSYDKAARNVQLALDNNQSVTIAYVYREPLDALANEKGGVLERAMSRGRPVTLQALVKGHAGASKKVRQLQQKFGDDPRFAIEVIDNSRGQGKAVFSTLDAIPVVESEGLLEKFKNATDQAFKEGRISQTIYDATTSSYDTRQANGSESKPAGVQPGSESKVQGRGQPGETRYSVNRAEQKNPAASRVEGTSADRFKRTEALQQGVTDLQEGKITLDKYNRMVDELRPVYPYAAVPAITTKAEAIYALETGRGQSPEKAAKYGLPSKELKAGDFAQLRLDIPSYQNHDAWVVSVHTPKSTNTNVQAAYDAGQVVGYESVAAITDAYFGMNQKAAAKIATGSAKGTIATVFGKWKPISASAAQVRADAALKDPAWTQIGMDPFRHSYFYDRNTMRPVLQADEVIQIGPLVLAKNATFSETGTDVTGAPIAFSNKQVGKESDSWIVSRDALGRFRFGAGAKAYRYVGDVANDILEKTPLIGSLKPVSPELSRYMRQMKVEVAKARNLTVDVAKNLQELPEDERQMISDVIEGQLAFGVIPPKRVLELAASMQALMTEQSTELVRLGMLSKEAAGRWDGQYLPRFYEQTLKSEAAGWVKAAKALLGRQKTMQGIGGSSLKSRGLFQTINVEDLNDWLAEGWEVRDAKFDSAKHDVITVWRDYTKDERENMGEIRDAMFRFVMGYNRSQRDIALGRLYERIATDIASRNEKPGFVQVPATKVEDTNAKRYGALADMWVPQEVLDQLSSNDEAMQGALLKLYRAGLSKWKEGKTVLNPVAHVFNVVSNVTMAHFAGVSYWDGHKYFGALKDLVSNSDMVKEAKDAGLFLGTFNQEELINMLPDELKVLAGKTESQAAKIGNLAWNIASLGLRKPLAAAYEGEDLYFRYLIYRDARQRGLEVQDAVDYAQKYIFTYDDLPKGARTIRDAPIGIPFFSWSYKAMPVLAQTLAEYPHRFAGPAALLAAVNAMGYAIAAGASGGDGDDDWWKLAQRYIMDPEFRAQANDLEKEERKNLPEWQKGLSIFGTPKVIRLGMDELTGLPLFLDISRMFPGGDMGDFVNNTGGLPLPSWLTPNSPVFSTLLALLGNRDLFTAKDVVSAKLDTAAEKSQKWGEWAYKQAAPAVAPFNYHFDRVMNALANATGKDIDLYFREYTGTDKMGQPVQAKYAAMQTVGIKVRPVDLDVSEQMANSERKKLIAEIDKQIKAVHRGEGRGFYTPKRADELVERLRTKKENLKEGLTVGGSEKD